MSLLNLSVKRLAAASALVILISGTATAQHDGPRFDSNGDKQVSKDEFLTGAAARFDAGDLNRDNFLSDDERKAQRNAQREARRDRRFAKTDVDGDGVISKEEFDNVRKARLETSKERREKFKKRRDVNGDGVVDEADKALRKDARKARRDEFKNKRKDRHAKRQKPDTNEDGFISREEHMAAADRMFTFLDANNDGVLSQGEGAKRRGRRGKRKLPR